MAKKKQVLVGMSGGLDSSMTAFLLQKKGYDVVGLTLRLADNFIEDKSRQFDVINRAAAVCKKLDIRHVVEDATEDFESCVVTDFAHEYFSGRTPNPCVICNKKLKWSKMLTMADDMGIPYVATGHYARIAESEKRFFIKKGADPLKDQSYFLWSLSQEALSRTLFPLGNMKKEELKKLAEEIELPHREQSESQDICFIPEENYRRFLEKYYPENIKKAGRGKFIDKNGQFLGEHDGFYRFTIGQRKGLGVATGEPMYVREIRADTNTVVLVNKMDMEDVGCVVKNINWMAVAPIKETLNAQVKVRYRHPGMPCRLEPLANGYCHILFNEGLIAVTPGQSAVFYDGDKVLGGGLICQYESRDKNSL